jgi:hypothetical protein
MGTVLNLGSGPSKLNLPGFKETRFDIDPSVEPDICGDIRKLNLTTKYDLIVCQHILEHFTDEELTSIMPKLADLLTPTGAVIIFVPDLKATCKAVAERDLDTILYTSIGFGPIRAVNVIYGLSSVNDFYQHKTGFDANRLKTMCKKAGLPYQRLGKRPYELILWASPNPLAEWTNNLFS